MGSGSGADGADDFCFAHGRSEKFGYELPGSMGRQQGVLKLTQRDLA
jgi:hypothetical protein